MSQGPLVAHFQVPASLYLTDNPRLRTTHVVEGSRKRVWVPAFDSLGQKTERCLHSVSLRGLGFRNTG